jgi:hypothetical protein
MLDDALEELLFTGGSLNAKMLGPLEAGEIACL